MAEKLIELMFAFQKKYNSLVPDKDGLAEFLIATDVVPVVRCKDCKWYAPNNNGLWYGCAFDTRNKDDEPKPDDFCSYGERKDK